MNHPILGILGGVGPYATTIFMQEVIEATPAKKDQDNIPMLVVNDPQIPDRTAFILGKSHANPLPEMVRVAKKIQDLGADYLAIPCNTAHYFYDEISQAVHIPVLNIMKLCVDKIKKDYPATTHVGLLATDGTIESKVFQQYFQEAGISVVAPSENVQENVMHYIYHQVKANNIYDQKPLLSAIDHLYERGCGLVVLGCTELSAGFKNLSLKSKDALDAHVIDAMQVLAQACVSFYIKHRVNNL